MKIHVDEKWLFSDDLKAEGSIFEITDAKEVTSKKGTLIPCIMLLGNTTKSTGEFRLSTWNIVNLAELIKTFGEDSEGWKGFKVKVIPAGTKVRIEK